MLEKPYKVLLDDVFEGPMDLLIHLIKKNEVDIYDIPIIDHVGKGQKEIDFAVANREILKNFLGVIKGGDVSPLLRFVFITGISRFSRVSIFSELNNLNDISMNQRFADMFGYTHEELGNCFECNQN